MSASGAPSRIDAILKDWATDLLHEELQDRWSPGNLVGLVAALRETIDVWARGSELCGARGSAGRLRPIESIPELIGSLVAAGYVAGHLVTDEGDMLRLYAAIHGAIESWSNEPAVRASADAHEAEEEAKRSPTERVMRLASRRCMSRDEVLAVVDHGADERGVLLRHLREAHVGAIREVFPTMPEGKAVAVAEASVTTTADGRIDFDGDKLHSLLAAYELVLRIESTIGARPGWGRRRGSASAAPALVMSAAPPSPVSVRDERTIRVWWRGPVQGSDDDGAGVVLVGDVGDVGDDFSDLSASTSATHELDACGESPRRRSLMDVQEPSRSVRAWVDRGGEHVLAVVESWVDTEVRRRVRDEVAACAAFVEARDADLLSARSAVQDHPAASASSPRVQEDQEDPS